MAEDNMQDNTQGNEAANTAVNSESSAGAQDKTDQTAALPRVASSDPLDAAPQKEHHETIYDILMNQDEITWQSLILELIKTEKMDPWDVNVSQLAKMYIKALKKLKEMNLRLSGKVLLAAALLLRIKSSRLVGDDLLEFDRLLASGENADALYAEEGFVQGELGAMGVGYQPGQAGLIPRTPQPRKRKVSVYDLIDALAIALNVKRRRILNQIQTTTMHMPEKKLDISKLMDDLYGDVVEFLTKEQGEKISFTTLVPGESKMDKILTFIPLLHLTNARRVDLEQEDHFKEIWIKLAKQDAQKTLQAEDDEPQAKEIPKKTPKRRKAKSESAAKSEAIPETVPAEMSEKQVSVNAETSADSADPASPAV
jgi:segregation and condensation protein A